jgi:hypothetical protein
MLRISPKAARRDGGTKEAAVRALAERKGFEPLIRL